MAKKIPFNVSYGNHSEPAYDMLERLEKINVDREKKKEEKKKKGKK